MPDSRGCSIERVRGRLRASARLAVAFLALYRHYGGMLMSPNRPARLYYGPNGFRILMGGDHVVCAVSGVPIPLDELRYWSVDRQEAYASCALAVRAITGRAPAAG